MVLSPPVRERGSDPAGARHERCTQTEKQSWEMRKTAARVWGASAGFVFPSPRHQAGPQQAQEKAAWGTGVAQEQQGGGARSQPHQDQQLQQQLQKFSPFQLYQSPDSACCRKSDSLYLELCSVFSFRLIHSLNSIKNEALKSLSNCQVKHDDRNPSRCVILLG